MIPIPKNCDYVLVFAHKEAQAHRIVTYNLESELESLSIERNPEIVAIHIDLVEKHKIRINSRNNRCKNYEQFEDFYLCVRNESWNIMNNANACKFPGVEEFIPKNVSLEECQEAVPASNAFDAFLNATYRRTNVRNSSISNITQSNF